MADQAIDDILKRRFDTMGCGRLQDRIKAFNDAADGNQKKLAVNPFSETYKLQKHKGRMHYGRPETGSQSERRGIKAGNHVYKEILELCEVIDWTGIERPDGAIITDFGTLFNLYTRISDKVVGMLLRARKYGLVQFEGEMLYQRRDEGVIITMPLPYREIKERFKFSGDPANLGKLVTDDGKETVLSDTITSKYRRNVKPSSENANGDQIEPDEEGAAVAKPKLKKALSVSSQPAFKVPEFSATYGSSAKRTKEEGAKLRASFKQHNKKAKPKDTTHEDEPKTNNLPTVQTSDTSGNETPRKVEEPGPGDIHCEAGGGDTLDDVISTVISETGVVKQDSENMPSTKTSNDKSDPPADAIEQEVPGSEGPPQHAGDGNAGLQTIHTPEEKTTTKISDGIQDSQQDVQKSDKISKKRRTPKSKAGGKRTSCPEEYKGQRAADVEIAVQ